MPTYRYECGRCEAVHEIFHSMSEKPRTKCPDCGGRLTRLIGSGGGVILKGSGFYTTDYRPDSYHSAAKKDRDAAAPAKPEAAKSDGAKSDGTKSDAAKSDGGKKADAPAAKSGKKKGKK